MNQTHSHPTTGSEEATGYYLEGPFGFSQGQEEIRILCPRSIIQRPYSRIHKKLSPKSEAVRNKTLLMENVDVFIWDPDLVRPALPLAWAELQ